MQINTWMVRAGRGGEHFDDFREKQIIAMGWAEVGDISRLSREAITEKIASIFPEYKKQRAVITASQLFRFCSEIKEGDRVLSYDSSRRVYLIGKVAGPYQYGLKIDPDLTHFRKVEWLKELDRDQISVPTRNTLGAISTLFLISEKPAQELSELLQGKSSVEHSLDEEAAEANEEDLLRDIQSRSREFIKDKLDKLEWDQMQEVVAGMLRAMGYKTRVSPSGPDRGKDIVASPDGFGFESPRIVVEVKHRNAQMGAEAVRSFLGGRHKDDKGLYVSTGGFSKDAHYEAERAAIPVMLMDLDGLVDGVLEHYENLDADVRALIPLTKVYWPTY
jgi:restriction system protein